MSKISTFILSTTDGEEWAVSSNWKVKREDTSEIFGGKKRKEKDIQLTRLWNIFESPRINFKSFR